ncbi:hypothetical protein [Piscibacillus salipiscarius]|uniref:Uncharacterized protein n=1 Tax=Piscibacillus salipiscarius TaxID=299480 RepID=A0ABW5QEL4_9BACI|nr:hypothetical protein [Piscibacillus salipiscarius]
MKLKLGIILVITSVILSACLYPDSQRVENTPTNDEQLEQVQNAVHQYQEQHNGLLPIKNRDQNTPLFIKYPIDFNKLKESNIMGQPPANSYERGGAYSYVIIDPENKAIVKVSDVRVNQKLRTVNYEINLYRNENLYPPYGEMLFKNYFKLDYESLGIDQPFTVKSPYTRNKLDVIINAKGQALVDYRPDVYKLLEENNIESYDGDLRNLLVQEYPLVPTYSPPMYLEDGEIIFKHENKTKE